MIKRYKEANEKYKGLYYEKGVMFKCYLTGVIFSLAICLLFYLPIINMANLTYHFTLIAFLLLLTTLLFLYLAFYFKDKALMEYVEEAKNVDLFIIRIVDVAIIGLISGAVFVILTIISKMILR